MAKLRIFWGDNARSLGWLILAAAGLAWLLVYRLGSLTGGLSYTEVQSATNAVGWHGIYHQPLQLPLNLVRSVVFALVPDHGQTLTRLPNIVFGAWAIINFAALVRLWHGVRTGLLASVMFATSAWVLHASRLASFDVMYLWAMTSILLSYVLLQKYSHKTLIVIGCLLVWGSMLYVPGMIWLVLVNAYFCRTYLKNAWSSSSQLSRLTYVVAVLIWLPLLVFDMTKITQLRIWLGLPSDFVPATVMIKNLVALPVHLFIRGPQYPEMWLGRTPLLDIFTLSACVIGIYFYATHLKAGRSRFLMTLFLISLLLVWLVGPVGFSLFVPLLYVAAAAGVAYLLHEWLSVFPNNPLARSLGIGLVALAVSLSCLYNVRAYFIAWPHNSVTKTVFRYHR